MFINGIHFQEYAKLEYGRLLWRRPEFRARLVSLEQAHHVLRAEIRADIKELQATIRDVLK